MLYMSAYLIRVNPNTLNWRQLTEMKSPVNERGWKTELVLARLM